MDHKQDKAALVASIPPILSCIMKNLSAKQLNSCAQVCKLWHDIAQTTKKQRKKICWFFFFHCQPVGPSRHHIPCYAIHNKDSCLVPFVDNINNLPIEPALALIFCTKSIIRRYEPFFPPTEKILKRKRDSDCPFYRLDKSSVKYPVIGSLMPYLPNNCEVGFCTARGITGTLTDNSSSREMEFCPALSAIYFPHLPGVKIHRFTLSGFNCAKEINFSSHTGISVHEQVKCLIVFLYDRIDTNPGAPYNKIISHYVEKQNWEIALGGAYIDHIFFPKHKHRRRNQSYGIAFIGENINAASVLIKSEINTREKIAEQLKVLTETDLLKTQCIAFMFTCVARGFGLYEEDDVESSVFRKMFPSVPLFGVFGNGEIGINYVPDLLVKKEEPYSWHQSYTTVFVLISVTN